MACSRRWWPLVAILVVTMSMSPSFAESSDDTTPKTHDLDDITVYDVLGLIFMTVGLAISSAGGIGGGSILVPSLVLIMSFPIKRAAPISTFGVLGGAIANGWFNLRKRHPKVDRPLIDSNLSMIMIPVVMGGAVVGAVLANLLPTYVISLLFVVVLTASGWRTLQKASQLRRKETAVAEFEQLIDGVNGSSSDTSDSELGKPKAVKNSVGQPSDRLEICSQSDGYYVEDGSLATGSANGSDDDAETQSTALARILEDERHISKTKQLQVFACYLGIVVASIAGKLVEYNGIVYWFLLLVEIPWVAAFAVFSARQLNNEYRIKQAAGLPPVEGDIQWTSKMALWFPIGCTAAGLIAGLFGIGGAIVASPLMLEMGVVPEVAAATSALMVLYSAAAALIKFIVLNMVVWDWAALLFVLAFVVTAFSQVVILGYVRRTGRQSVIVFCIGVSILLGAALMTYRAVKSTIDETRS